jgi:hypothetical protein
MSIFEIEICLHVNGDGSKTFRGPSLKLPVIAFDDSAKVADFLASLNRDHCPWAAAAAEMLRRVGKEVGLNVDLAAARRDLAISLLKTVGHHARVTHQSAEANSAGGSHQAVPARSVPSCPPSSRLHDVNAGARTNPA